MAATPAVRALDRATVAYTLHPYDAEHPSGQGFGEAAAAALGTDPARLFKTLVTRVDETLTVAVVPVSGQLDLKALAAAAGGRRAASSRAPPAPSRTPLASLQGLAASLRAVGGRGHQSIASPGVWPAGGSGLRTTGRTRRALARRSV